MQDILTIGNEVSQSENGKTPQFVVLKGRAGVGKTTMLQYLSRLWAQNTWGQQFSVIVFLKMRVIMSIKEKLTLSELLNGYSFYKLRVKLPKSWITCNQGRILVLIGE